MSLRRNLTSPDRLRLVVASPAIERLFTITGLQQVIALHPNLEAAQQH